ncbi:hypothetical protein BN7_6656 [Wickerhamomyces ciferrii]|uniref:Uncharacterized protein n=1 Tax=Wickerhamomyces ciferrii (strain ATCC 14091 / BCRC 22168 / CBS 111 / JCM 3599 / NBRC 0793 / NRRL Y-1031 F-60-10) TaxID=1206466 RepID=K0KY96_WICCF|nr:uncharacterized protein BN7_6656 [Wickerhamomyces ciferrii]CCH47047.1 hypothetical protein BN7_6656 [Wickerhamomyces ciferrii]
MSTPEELDKERVWDEFHRANQNQRLHLHPIPRLTAFGFVSGITGFINGARTEYKNTGLRFLAENSHRLPKTKGNWYFYYKRRNYVCLTESIRGGLRNAFKYSSMIVGLFSIEAGLDKIRGKIDMLNTMGATIGSGYVYAKYYKLSSHGVSRMVKNGVFIGLLFGGIQDILYYLRNGELWYINGHQKFTA